MTKYQQYESGSTKTNMETPPIQFERPNSPNVETTISNVEMTDITNYVEWMNEWTRHDRFCKKQCTTWQCTTWQWCCYDLTEDEDSKQIEIDLFWWL